MPKSRGTAWVRGRGFDKLSGAGNFAIATPRPEHRRFLTTTRFFHSAGIPMVPRPRRSNRTVQGERYEKCPERLTRGSPRLRPVGRGRHRSAVRMPSRSHRPSWFRRSMLGIRRVMTVNYLKATRGGHRRPRRQVLGRRLQQDRELGRMTLRPIASSSFSLKAWTPSRSGKIRAPWTWRTPWAPSNAKFRVYAVEGATPQVLDGTSK